jgi:hypothetical protein
VLAQLALDGFVSTHPTSARVLARLRARGLVRRDALGVFSPAFAEFLRADVRVEELDVVQKSSGGGAWAMLRLPLGAGLAVLVALLGNGEPDPATAGLLVPALGAVGLPLVRSVVAALMASRSRSA